MNSSPKILFTATFSTSFIQSDIQLLQRSFQTTVIINSGFLAVIRFAQNISKHTITFSWFASVYSSILIWMTKLFRKKSILILGGVDVAKIPELNYGIWNSWWKSKIVRYGIMKADVVLAVDNSIRNDAMALAQYDGKNILVLPTGYDDTFWMPGKTKEKFVLTVANCFDEIRFRIKGIDFLYEVAQSMPDVHFVLIGMNERIKNKYSPPANVSTYAFKPHGELLAIYQQAKVYFQPSSREGLPNTLCEAMLCECSPIGTNVGGIPTVIGTTGTIIPFGDIESAKQGILSGFSSEQNSSARKRILENFSMEQRERKLIEIVNSFENE